MKNIFASKKSRKGVALIIVMLLLLVVTTSAMYAIQAMNTDRQMTTAFQYNRQAAQAAHEAGIYILDTKNNVNPMELVAVANNASISTAMELAGDAGDDADARKGALEQAWGARMSVTKWYKNITPFSGLRSILTAPDPQDALLRGDLSRATMQVASIGAPVLNQKQVEGFSNGDAYCSFTMHADSYALFGQAVPLRGTGDNRYYLLADLNGRVSGFKREMGLLNAEPMPCNN